MVESVYQCLGLAKSPTVNLVPKPPQSSRSFHNEAQIQQGLLGDVELRRSELAECMTPKSRWGDLWNVADQVEPEFVAMFIDEGVGHLSDRPSFA